MESLTTFKVLLGTVAIPVVILAGMTQIQFSIETSSKALNKGSELEQNRGLESKSATGRSLQNSSALTVLDRPVDQIQFVAACNAKFSSCPIP